MPRGDKPTTVALALKDGWIYEDALPVNISRKQYDSWFKESLVLNGVRMGPPLSVTTTDNEQTTLEPNGEGQELISVREALRVLSEFCDGTQPFVGERFKKQLRNAIRAIPRVSAASTAPEVDQSVFVDREVAAKVAFDAVKAALTDERSYSTLQAAATVAANVRRVPAAASPAAPQEDAPRASDDTCPKCGAAALEPDGINYNVLHCSRCDWDIRIKITQLTQYAPRYPWHSTEDDYKGDDMKLPDIEIVSAKVHEAWMESKKQQGVTTRRSEKGEELMVPYADLSEEAKELDRGTVRAVYAAIETTCEATE